VKGRAKKEYQMKKCILLMTILAIAPFLFASGSQESTGTPILSVTYGEHMSEFMDPAIEKFKAETGAEVETIVIPQGVNADEKVALDLAGGIATDVFIMDTYRVPEFAEAGYIKDLSGYTADWSDYQAIHGGLRDVCNFNGGVYAVPHQTDVRMLWYYRPALESIGLPGDWSPRNWDELLDAAEKIKAANPSMEYPIYLPVGTKMGEATTMQGFYMLLLGSSPEENDGNRLRDRGRQKWIGKSPAILKTLEFYDTVFNKKELSNTDIYYTPDFWGDARISMASGNTAFMLGGSWEYRRFLIANGEPETIPDTPHELFGWTAFPGSGVRGAKDFTCISGGWAFAVNEATEKEDLAVKMIKTVIEPDFLGPYLANRGRTTTSTDITEMDIYKSRVYLKETSEQLLPYTTGRDTYPGYSKVSLFIQQATEAILDGETPREAMDLYYDNLVAEFGEDQVLDLTK